MNPLEFCDMLCDNTERALRTMRQDVRTASECVDELSRRHQWTQDLRLPLRLNAVMAEVEQLLHDLEYGALTLTAACLDLADDSDPAALELLRVELSSLRYKAMEALRTLSETLPRAVDALNLPEAAAAIALKADDTATRCEVVLHGSSLIDALRDLLFACGRAAAPLRDIIRHTTGDAWNDVQVVELLNEVVSLGLHRGLQFLLGTVDTGRSFATPAATSPAPSGGVMPASRISDWLTSRAVRWWGVTYERWLSDERMRVRRVNRFALWHSRSGPTRLFLFPVDAEIGGPILMVGEQGHHPLLNRLAHYVGVLTVLPGASRRTAKARSGDALLVRGCPNPLQERVRRELEQLSRKSVMFR